MQSSTISNRQRLVL
ncbi:unnamed protein product, partial [Rotaria sp. Silwood2]